MLLNLSIYPKAVYPVKYVKKIQARKLKYKMSAQYNYLKQQYYCRINKIKLSIINIILAYQMTILGK